MQPTNPTDYRRGQADALAACLERVERLLVELRREASSLTLPTRKPHPSGDESE